MNTFDESQVNREGNGQFGVKPQSAPETELVSPPGREPLHAYVYLQVWERDMAVTVDEVALDVRGVLDTMPLSELPTPDDVHSGGELDHVFETAQAAGLVHHDGPFVLQIEDNDEYASYYEQRVQAGQDTAPAAVVTDGKAYERLAGIDQDLARLTRLRETAVQQALADEVLSLYPEAVTAVLYPRAPAIGTVMDARDVRTQFSVYDAEGNLYPPDARRWDAQERLAAMFPDAGTRPERVTVQLRPDRA